MDPVTIAAIIGAGTQVLGMLNKPKQKIAPAKSTPFGENQQGIASIELDTIGDETLNQTDDIKFKEDEVDEVDDVDELSTQEGLQSLLSQLPIQQAAEGTAIEGGGEGMSGSEAAEYTKIAMGLLQLLLEKDKKPTLSPARAPSFSVESQGIGPLQTIGMNMGGDPSDILARPMFKGDPVVGPGGPKDDIIPVLASDGEFMLSKAAVDHAGGGNHELGIARLKAFNNKGNQRYGN